MFSPMIESMGALELRFCSARDEFEIHNRFVGLRWGFARVRRPGEAFGLGVCVGFGFRWRSGFCSVRLKGTWYR